MSYTYPIDAQAMFDDRTHQFIGFGLPADDVARVRAATTDFWNERARRVGVRVVRAGRRVHGHEPATARRPSPTAAPSSRAWPTTPARPR